MRKGKIFHLLALVSLLIFSSCSDDKDVLSGDNLITSFKIVYGANYINGFIDENTSTILVEFPNDLSFDNVLAEISVSENATTNLSFGESIDLNERFAVTVTAENGEIREYTISAYTVNLLKNPNGESDGELWNFNGESSIEVDFSGDNIFTIVRYDDGITTNINRTIEFSRDYSNKFIVFIGDMTTEKVVEGSITRHPYFWGHQNGVFNLDNDPIEEVIQGGMRHQGSANVWEIVHGIHPLLPAVESVYFQMGQASQANDPPDGTKSKCKAIEVRIFQSESDSELFVSNLYEQ